MDSIQFVNSYQLLETIHDVGMWVESDGRDLLITPKGLLSVELRELIRAKKSYLLALLNSKCAQGVPCRVCGWQGRSFNVLCAFHFDIQVELDLKVVEEESSCHSSRKVIQMPVRNQNISGSRGSGKNLFSNLTES